MSTQKLKQLTQELQKKKKIDSPLAKYNSAGQLFCVLCNAQVKNEMYWTGHVNGKQHRENLVALKGGKKLNNNSGSSSSSSSSSSGDAVQQQHTFKRPAPPPGATPPSALKKPDEEEDDDDDEDFTPPQKVQKLSSSSENSSSTKLNAVELAEKELAKLTSDHIEAVNDEEQSPRGEEDPPPAPSVSLPAGFFDDPKEDAKARGKKFKDPQEAEWERFVKEMASEDLKSTEIMGKDEEKGAVERELEQIEEQMVAWQRVIELEKKAEQLKRSKVVSSSNKMEVDDHEEVRKGVGNEEEEQLDEEDDDDEDELDYDEEMDWRNKKR